MSNKSISFYGNEGSFTHLAAKKYFNNLSELSGKSEKNFKAIFQSVTDGISDYGIVPIENSLAGSIYEVYDLLTQFDLNIIGEAILGISHNLLAKKASKKTDLKKIYSHPKAIEQCLNFFESNPHLEKAVFSDTASAAKFVAESNDISFAAIANKESARLYNLEVLQENIEDNPNNFTRFIILSKSAQQSNDVNKCGLIFSLKHQPASLFRALEVLSKDNINVTKIESRPIHGKPFEYMFTVDFEFEYGKREIAQHAFERLQSCTVYLRNLGLYKKTEELF